MNSGVSEDSDALYGEKQRAKAERLREQRAKKEKENYDLDNVLEAVFAKARAREELHS